MIARAKLLPTAASLTARVEVYRIARSVTEPASLDG